MYRRLYPSTRRSRLPRPSRQPPQESRPLLWLLGPAVLLGFRLTPLLLVPSSPDPSSLRVPGKVEAGQGHPALLRNRELLRLASLGSQNPAHNRSLRADSPSRPAAIDRMDSRAVRSQVFRRRAARNLAFRRRAARNLVFRRRAARNLVFRHRAARNPVFRRQAVKSLAFHHPAAPNQEFHLPAARSQAFRRRAARNLVFRHRAVRNPVFRLQAVKSPVFHLRAARSLPPQTLQDQDRLHPLNQALLRPATRARLHPLSPVHLHPPNRARNPRAISP